VRNRTLSDVSPVFSRAPLRHRGSPVAFGMVDSLASIHIPNKYQK
jgi:hypothetical protein